MLETELFSDPHIFHEFKQEILKHSSNTPLMPENFLANFQTFIKDNDFIIKPADKNAGICVMTRKEYSAEVFRQLNDTNNYRPSSSKDFENCIQKLKASIQKDSQYFPPNLKLLKFIPDSYKPSKFYILPKIHKPFNDFPKGRPISSTLQTFNRGLSKLLDLYLQPVMNHVPDLILDTHHFILLLQNVKLEPNSKYMLVVADIEGLYPNLKIPNCRKHCCTMYHNFKHLIQVPVQLTSYQLNKIMKWCLGYSFVEYDGNIYLQVTGIPMGNCASVSIANITVYHELKNMFLGYPEIVFNKRFIDDIFMIVKIDSIDNVDNWLDNLLVHDYLKFTKNHSPETVNFLDVKVELLPGNIFRTSLYSKPMSKHQYVHYKSNHPKHLLNSLPYSQGLRILRICSENSFRIDALNILMEKFRSRQYPNNVLNMVLSRLRLINRDDLLKPKKKLLISNLVLHDRDILDSYGYDRSDFVFDLDLDQERNQDSNTFITVPYYNNIRKLGHIYRDLLLKHLSNCNDVKLSNIINCLSIHIAYKKINSLSDLMK
jgi:hypothetical protein